MAISTTGSCTRGTQASATSITLSYTVAGDADYLLIAVRLLEQGTTPNTTATFNGLSMTKIVQHEHTLTANPPWNVGYLFGRVAPTTGTHDVVVTAQNASDYFEVYAQGFKGVDQTTPTGNTNDGQCPGGSTSNSLSLSSASGRYAVASFTLGNDASGWTNTGDGTFLGSAVQNHYLNLIGAAGAATVNFSFSWTTSDYGTSVAAELLPAGASDGLMWL